MPPLQAAGLRMRVLCPARRPAQMQRQLLRKLGAEQPQAEQRLARGAMSLHRAL